MEYKVPQNIDVEDRVVGPLTLRQFFILMGGALICLFLYLFLNFFMPLFYFLAALIMGGAIALAFTTYGDQHPEKIVMSAIATFSNPRRRVWKRVVSQREMKEATEKVSSGPQKAGQELAQKKHEVDFDRLSKIVDTGSFADEEVKGRVANLGSKERVRVGGAVPDAITPGREEVKGVDRVLTSAEKEAKKTDPLISQLASVSPLKMFKYDQIDKKGEIVTPTPPPTEEKK